MQHEGSERAVVEPRDKLLEKHNEKGEEKGTRCGTAPATSKTQRNGLSSSYVLVSLEYSDRFDEQKVLLIN